MTTHAVTNRFQDRALCGAVSLQAEQLIRAKIELGEVPTCPKCKAELATLMTRAGVVLPPQPAVEYDPPAAVGTSVLYQSFGTPKGEYQSLARAAIVTQLNEDGTVGLCILNPTGMFFAPSVRFADPPEAGCWSWPKVPIR